MDAAAAGKLKKKKAEFGSPEPRHEIPIMN
jgi:hypothetical protein